MITLINGYVQNPAGLIVPNGSIKLQLNVDATIIAAPYGFVAADIPVVFQFNSAGQIQPNPPATAAKIWSNEELQPQLSPTLLGTYYLVTFYDQNGAVLNATPLWWQFPESSGATVDISQMTAISTVGGNIIYYPTSFGGGGSVTSVTFTGDGVVLSSTPSAPVTTSGTITAALLTQSANLVLAGPTTGAAATPTFRALVAADIPASIFPLTTEGDILYENATPAPARLAIGSTGQVLIVAAGLPSWANLPWNDLGSAAGNLTLANAGFSSTFNQTSAVNWTWANTTAATVSVPQNSPNLIIAGTYWTGSASAADTWTINNVVGAGTNPATVLNITHSGSPTTPTLVTNASFSCGAIQCGGMTSAGSISILNGNNYNMQSSNSAAQTFGQVSELLTLSLVSAHTDTVGNLLPAGAIIDAVTFYITQTISGGSTPTTIAVGDAGTSNRFVSTGTPLTAGSSAVGLNQIDAGTSSQAAAAKVRVTLDQTPGQGIVRITVFYRQFVAPTS